MKIAITTLLATLTLSAALPALAGPDWQPIQPARQARQVNAQQAMTQTAQSSQAGGFGLTESSRQFPGMWDDVHYPELPPAQSDSNGASTSEPGQPSGNLPGMDVYLNYPKLPPLRSNRSRADVRAGAIESMKNHTFDAGMDAG